MSAAHEVTIKHPSAFDGYTAECSCGWRSEEMATTEAAASKAVSHSVDRRRGIVFVNPDGSTTQSYLELS